MGVFYARNARWQKYLRKLTHEFFSTPKINILMQITDWKLFFASKLTKIRLWKVKKNEVNIYFTVPKPFPNMNSNDYFWKYKTLAPEP